MTVDAAPQSGAQVPSTTESPAPATPPANLWNTNTNDLRSDRRSRASETMKGRKPNQPRGAAPTAPKAEAAPAVAPPEVKPAEKPVDKPAEAKAQEPATPPVVEPDDDRTKRGIAAVERREAQFRAEQARIKEEHDRREARIVARENEIEGKTTSVSQLKGLRPAQLIGELKKLGYDSSAFDAVSRVAWAQTEAGAKDPKSLDAARDAEMHFASRSQADEVSALKAELAELRGEFGKRDQLAAAREAGMRWVETAVKDIPGDKPTLLGRAFAKNADSARARIIQIGSELEKTNGETPTHAEVFAEYDRRERSYLEERGVDVEAMLNAASAAPPTPPAKTPAAPSKPANRTLDVSQPANGTRPREPKVRPMSHQDRVAHARELRNQTPH